MALHSPGGSTSGGGGSFAGIPEVSSDPVSPSPEDAWVRYTAGVGVGTPIGLLLALTQTGTAATYEFSYRTNEGTTVRVNLT